MSNERDNQNRNKQNRQPGKERGADRNQSPRRPGNESDQNKTQKKDKLNDDNR